MSQLQLRTYLQPCGLGGDTSFHHSCDLRSRVRGQMPRNGTLAPAQPSTKPTAPTAVPFEIIEHHNEQSLVIAQAGQVRAPSHVHIKRSGPSRPNPRASWSHPLQSLFIFLLLLLFYPQRESFFPPQPAPATPRHLQSASSLPLSPVPAADLSAPRLQAHFLILHNVCPR